MEVNNLITSLQKRISEYKKSGLYSITPLRQDILSVEIAVCLFEMAFYCNRVITEEERFWFKGAYYISSDITGEWSDISDSYEKIIDVAKNKKFI